MSIVMLVDIFKHETCLHFCGLQLYAEGIHFFAKFIVCTVNQSSLYPNVFKYLFVGIKHFHRVGFLLLLFFLCLNFRK